MSLTWSCVVMSQHNIHPAIESVVGCLGLTPRQSEIACRVAMGLGMPELSRVLSISPATVRTHLRDIFRCLKVRSRAELVSKILANVLSLMDRSVADHADDSPSDSAPYRPDRPSLVTARSWVARTAHTGTVSRACEDGNAVAVVTSAPRQA